MSRVPLAERFWSYVDQRGPDECWEWTGYRKRTGYGEITTKPPSTRGSRGEITHRVAWRLTFGPIPTGMLVCHTCDNPPCCNPAHLFLGTDADNMRDRDTKGRNVRGSAVGTAKLTEESVVLMRRLHADGWTGRALAKRFGVCASQVSNIVRGRWWRGVGV